MLQVSEFEEPKKRREEKRWDVAPGAHPSVGNVALDAHVQKRPIELT